MKALAVIVNPHKPRAAAVLARLARRARERGMDLLADDETARLVPSCAGRPIGEALDGADAVMALGGDGTMLRAVRALGGRDKPVIGLNLGALGFLTSVTEADVERAVDCLAADDVTFSRRVVAECVVTNGGREVAAFRALNDVVVQSRTARVVTLAVSVNDEQVTSYVCDGLIVSTPTGSTGHSLSAGGPILLPEARVFVLSVICPHTLSSRPLVLPDSSRIALAADADASPLLLAADGQAGRELQPGDAVAVRRGDRDVRFIHLPGYSYFAVLRQKLHWSGSSL